MEIRSIEEEDYKEALALAKESYQEECRACSHLIRANFENELKEILSRLFQNAYGKAAFENGRMIGYLAFAGPWEGFFGQVKGVFSPLGGSAFIGPDRNKLASRLFQASAAELAADGIFCIGICLYGHDLEVGQSFTMNGFGIRCSDAILDLAETGRIEKSERVYDIEELLGEEKRRVWTLKLGLVKHMASSPIFFPTPTAHMEDWFERDDIRVFAAKDKNGIIGCMAFSADGESFISEHPRVANICMAYVDEAYRKTGAANQLLEHVRKEAKSSGMTHLGVDYETMNPTALHFWTKHFEPYTYSYVRRLDERVLGYLEYLDKWAANQSL